MRKKLKKTSKFDKWLANVRKDLRKSMIKIAEEDKYIPSVKDIEELIRGSIEKDAPRVTCKNCGHTWIPYPKRWNEEKPEESLVMIKGEPVKVLICSACNSKVKVPFGAFWKILSWWTDMDKLHNVFREEAEKMRKEYGFCITATEGLKSGGTRTS